MIAKMNFISITGPKHDIDRVIDTYLSKHEIHLENALVELNNVKDLMPYDETNPYKEYISLGNELIGYTDGAIPKELDKIDVDKAMEYLDSISPKIHDIQKEIEQVKSHKDSLQAHYDKIAPFKGLRYDINTILNFKFIRFRFGRIPKKFWYKFKHYVDDDHSTIFIECAVDETYVWGVYFVPVAENNRIDAVYSSLNFERTFIPNEYYGTPEEACDNLMKEIGEIDTALIELKSKLNSLIDKEKSKLFSCVHRIQTASDNFDVRKLAACTKEGGHSFYIICGWMPSDQAKLFSKESGADPNVVVILENSDSSVSSKPPTKLKNPKIFKPFEMFIRMYGLPSYGEFDPTIFVALTYAFIFGAMFGDVGQGACLMIGGYLLYRFKRVPLAAIISCAGLFSTLFGFLFGSVFGFEDIIEPLWLRPVEHMTSLPFIGKLNTVFIISIAFGMGIIMIAMIINIINSIKDRNVERAFFDTNGIAGLVFYASITLVLVLFMTGHTLPGGIVLVVMFVIPLIIIALKEPLTNLVEKKTEIMPKEKGMFIVQGIFELFEVLLSYFSNTLSFVRIGAFAVSHAAMMEVVLMLAGAESGAPNILVIILGNIFVTGMEGLIVGIQVLRLEYYEIFSRFYKGTGREFKPYTKTNNE